MKYEDYNYDYENENENEKKLDCQESIDLINEDSIEKQSNRISDYRRIFLKLPLHHIKEFTYFGILLLLLNGVYNKKVNSNTENHVTESYVVEALNEYEERRNKLQDEIDELEKQKEQLLNERTYKLDNLILGEVEINNSKELYIIDVNGSTDIYDEIHNDFKVVCNWHSSDRSNHYEFCGKYIHLYQEDITPLAISLTDEELEEIRNNDGKLTTSQADKILERLRKEYHSSNKLELKK